MKLTTDSSRALLCSTAYVLLLLSSASTDESIIEQRDITFDLDYEHVMSGPFQEQMIVDPVIPHFPDEIGESRPGGFQPRGRRPSFGPRSFGGPPSLDYSVQFPVARPSPDNIHAICLHGDHRPQYPSSYFPDSGFGQLKRRANAVNYAESWFSMCCRGNETWGNDVTLCCATQAWEQSVQSFCEEDASVKDRVYACCKKTGNARLNCFQKDAPNPNYEPKEELPVTPFDSSPSSTEYHFNFEPRTCQGSVVTHYRAKEFRGKKKKKPTTSQKVDMNFPPGRPMANNIGSLCNNQKLRPLYTVNCLPRVGYEQVAHQAKTINRIEKGFKQCCKKQQDVLTCADQKWQEEINRFCTSEKDEFHCCSSSKSESDRFSCFESLSSEPHYNMTSDEEEPSLSRICDTHKILKKKFPVGFALKSFVSQCCPLPDQDKATCFTQKFEEAPQKLCESKKPASPAFRRCCRLPSQEVPQCITRSVMDAVIKASNGMRQRKKKRCPLS